MNRKRPQYSPYSLNMPNGNTANNYSKYQSSSQKNQAYGQNSVKSYKYNPLKHTVGSPQVSSQNRIASGQNSNNQRLSRDYRSPFNNNQNKQYSDNKSNQNLVFGQGNNTNSISTNLPPKNNPTSSTNLSLSSKAYGNKYNTLNTQNSTSKNNFKPLNNNYVSNTPTPQGYNKGSRINNPTHSQNSNMAMNPLRSTNGLNNLGKTPQQTPPPQYYTNSRSQSQNFINPGMSVSRSINTSNNLGRRDRQVSPINQVDSRASQQNRGSLSITRSMNDQYKRLNYGQLSTGLSNVGQSRGLGNPLNSGNSTQSYTGNPMRSYGGARTQKDRQRDKNLDNAKEKMRKLGTQKQALEQIFNTKYLEFKDHINKNLKEKFDAELKRALFHLWKHYKNCQDNPNKEMCNSQLRDNMQKIYNESAECRAQSEQFRSEVMLKERNTANVISKAIKEGTVIGKSGVESSSKQKRDQNTINERRNWLNTKITDYGKESELLTSKIKQIESQRNERVYDIKLKMEKEGRDEMEEKSRELLLMSVNTQIPEIRRLKSDVANLKVEYEQNRMEWINNGCGPNIGDIKIKELEKELYDLQKSKSGGNSYSSRNSKLKYY